MFTTVSDDSLIIYFNLGLCVCAHSSTCVFISETRVNLTSVYAGTGCFGYQCIHTSMSVHLYVMLCVWGPPTPRKSNSNSN